MELAGSKPGTGRAGRSSQITPFLQQKTFHRFPDPFEKSSAAITLCGINVIQLMFGKHFQLVYIPLGDIHTMSDYFRRVIIKLLQDDSLHSLALVSSRIMRWLDCEPIYVFRTTDLLLLSILHPTLRNAPGCTPVMPSW
jgi:hypothetical protein